MSRAFLIVLDSLGVGGAPDAHAFGDAGSDTLGHIAQRCRQGDADRVGTRCGPLHVPNLSSLGLGECSRTATLQENQGLQSQLWLHGWAGCAEEVSTGKDSQSGHWEIAGTPVDFAWCYFPREQPAFPAQIVVELCERAGLEGILGNKHASGTQIIEELGEEHLRTGWPICYTSADSVFQIAAHEQIFGLERLYHVCTIAREILDPWRVGRVIARPFIGEHAGDFRRTANRKDYGVAPPTGTLLQQAERARREVVSLGKIGDLFCHTSTGREVKAPDNAAVFDALVKETARLAQGGLLLANFVDFDTLYGHRRDVPGYAAALEAFDERLPEFLAHLGPGDLAVITGDHGCDPTWPGSDHTRECIPVLAFGPGLKRRSLGRRRCFADVGATLAAHLLLPPARHGRSFLEIQ